jgi:hypothetical protein
MFGLPAPAHSGHQRAIVPLLLASILLAAGGARAQEETALEEEETGPAQPLNLDDIEARCQVDLSGNPSPTEVYRRCRLWGRSEPSTTLVPQPEFVLAPPMCGGGLHLGDKRLTVSNHRVYQGESAKRVDAVEFYRMVGREDLVKAQLLLESASEEERTANNRGWWVAGGGAAVLASISVVTMIAGLIATVVGGAMLASAFLAASPVRANQMAGYALPWLFLGPVTVASSWGGLLGSSSPLVWRMLYREYKNAGHGEPEVTGSDEKERLVQAFNRDLLLTLHLAEADVASPEP